MDRDIKDLKSDLKKLESKVEKLDSKIDTLIRELGAQSGRQMYDQINKIEANIEKMRTESASTKVDTNNIRKSLDFFTKTEISEIKKVLAAIYRNTDEVEKNLVDQRETYG